MLSINRVAFFVVATSAAVASLGCGTSQYEERVAKAVDNVRYANVFSLFSDKQIPLAPTPVTVRVPKVFESATPFTAQAADPGDPTKPIAPQRLFPGGIALPGLKYSYEATESDDSQGPLVYQCAIAATTLGEAAPGGASVADYIVQQLAQTYPSAGAPQWTSVECTTPDQGKLPVRALTLKTQMPFYTGPSMEVKQAPGVLQFYMFEGDGYRTIIGWRVPESFVKKLTLENLASLMAGTIKAQAQQAAPAR